MIFLLSFLWLFPFFIAAADTITIINKTPINLHGAFYYKNGNIVRSGESFSLISNQSIRVERPPRKAGYDREIYFSVFDETLKEKLTRGESQFMPHFNTGSLKGDTFYIIFEKDRFKGVNKTEYTFLPLTRALGSSAQKVNTTMFKVLRSNYGDYAHKRDKVTVSTDLSIAREEEAFMQVRLKKVKQTLEKLLQEKLTDEEVPRIALCASGGGYRAMLSFLGSYEGAKETQLLDTISYMAGLSGGAWGVTLATMADNPLEHTINRIHKKKITDNVNIGKLMDVLWEKFIFTQPISSIDVYGLLLCNRLLGGLSKNPYDITLSRQQVRLRPSERPYPIYTAIVTKKPYEWVEFTPHQVGSPYLQGFIPSWSFNSSFVDKKSVSIAPEESIGFLMGIWGSAFSANISEIYKEFRNKINNSIILSVLDYSSGEEILGNKRILPAKVANFTFGMQESPRWQQRQLTLIDAGLAFNIPTPPLHRRNVDIIIVLDNSDYPNKPAEALTSAREYAQERNILFPEFVLEKINEKPLSVFWQKDNPQAPIIIYMPLVQDPVYAENFDPRDCIRHSFCSTSNFEYTREQAEQLSGLTKFTMRKAMPEILNTIREFIQKRRDMAA